MKRIKLSRVLLPALLALFVSIGIIFICSKNPFRALSLFFLGTFRTRYNIGALLNYAALLMTASLGSSIAIRGGNINLGGEAQIYAGGFITALILTRFPTGPSVLVFLLSLIAAVASGALIASISAFLKEAKGANVLLTSFLLSSAIIPVIDSLITYSKEGSGENLLALPYIAEPYRFTQVLAPSPLSIVIFIAPALCIITHIFLRRTFYGRALDITGISEEFALYSGYKTKRSTVTSLAVSGALHALTGLFAVCGTYYTCHKDFYLGMGWSALSASLIVAANPRALIIASILLSWLYTSADRVGLMESFGFDISDLLQGCILFAISLSAGRNKR